MTQPLTIEELEQALNIPSFEEELELSDLPHKIPKSENKAARIVRCRVCGTPVLLGPEDSFQCPKAPHDAEDDPEVEDDIEDVVD